MYPLTLKLAKQTSALVAVTTFGILFNFLTTYADIAFSGQNLFEFLKELYKLDELLKVLYHKIKVP